MKLFRVPEDGSLYCPDCLPHDGHVTAVELAPDLFPGTWTLLCCSACGAGAADGEAAVDALPGDGVPLVKDRDRSRGGR